MAGVPLYVVHLSAGDAMEEIRAKMGRGAITRGRGNGWSEEPEED